MLTFLNFLLKIDFFYSARILRTILSDKLRFIDDLDVVYWTNTKTALSERPIIYSNRLTINYNTTLQMIKNYVHSANELRIFVSLNYYLFFSPFEEDTVTVDEKIHNVTTF